MKVICAWCENEGKETLIGEIGLYDLDMTSHGICLDHEKVLLQQIHGLKVKQHPRLRRPRHPRVRPRASAAPAMANCATPWRRRRQLRISPAQLSLPFADGETDQPAPEPEFEFMAEPGT
jgi:hypothetical protein